MRIFLKHPNIWWALIFFGLLIWMAIPMQAKELNTVPKEETFKDWRVLCAQKGDDNACQMIQTASVSEGQTPVFLMSIGSDKNHKGEFAVITVPIGVYLANGIEIRVDKRRPFKVLYEVCDQTGCHAGFKLSGTALKAFKAGYDAKVRVWTGKTKAVEFPVSLRGFSKGLSYLKERH